MFNIYIEHSWVFWQFLKKTKLLLLVVSNIFEENINLQMNYMYMYDNFFCNHGMLRFDTKHVSNFICI